METVRQDPMLPAVSVARAWSRGIRRRWRMAMRWMLVTAGALVVTAFGLIATLHPSSQHVAQIMLYLAVSGALSLALGATALWLADTAQIGAIRLKLAIPSLLTALVIATNVILIAHQMFISIEDSQLLLAFLVFGIAVALVISASLAAAITTAIARIEAGARRIAAGDYGYRLAEEAPNGAAELARLAQWFNQMAASIEDAFTRRDVAETDRRQVVAAVSHDLRTPLTSIRALLEAIDDGVVTDPAVVRRYQHTMRAELDHLTVLLDDLFELSRLESGALQLEREPMALDDILSDALETTRGVADQAGIHLEGSVEGELPSVCIDARQIYRVLANLLQNAIRFTPSGGQIVIHAAATNSPSGQPELRVRILDTGTGITADDLPHIFERTYRGEQSRMRPSTGPHTSNASGAGLGLAIARGIVEAHGGRIWAESPVPSALRGHLAPGESPASRQPLPGTLVVFTLPVSQAHA